MPIHNSDSQSMETEVNFSEAELAATLPNTESEAQNMSMTKLAKAIWQICPDSFHAAQEISKPMRARFSVLIIALIPGFLLSPNLLGFAQNNLSFARDFALAGYIVNVVLSSALLGILALSMINFFLPNVIDKIPNLIKNIINTIDRVLLAASIGILGGVLGTVMLSTYLFYTGFEGLDSQLNNTPEIIPCVNAKNETIMAQAMPERPTGNSIASMPPHPLWLLSAVAIGSVLGAWTGKEAWDKYTPIPFLAIKETEQNEGAATLSTVVEERVEETNVEKKKSALLGCCGLFASPNETDLTDALEYRATVDRAVFDDTSVIDTSVAYDTYTI